MLNKKAKVTISRILGRSQESVISINIIDAENYNLLINVEMTTKDFAEALTGNGYSPAVLTEILDLEAITHLGQERETKIVFCKPAHHADFIERPKEQRKIVEADFLEKYVEDGWRIKDYGLQSRQTSTSHRYVIYRYIPDAD